MPKFHPEAPDLVVGPDGKWAAELIPGELRVYDLSATPSENQPNRLSPLETMRQEERSGRIFFVQSDRLMNRALRPTSASTEGISVNWRTFAVAYFMDILESEAFGNYRSLQRSVARCGCQVRCASSGAGLEVSSLHRRELAQSWSCRVRATWWSTSCSFAVKRCQQARHPTDEFSSSSAASSRSGMPRPVERWQS